MALILTRVKKTLKLVLALAGTLHLSAWAGDLTTDAAIGGAIGGALGGAIGAEVGGREGAVIGAGVGAAAGTAINTKDHQSSSHEGDRVYREDHYYHDSDSDKHQGKGSFCPPGQAKKGRC